MDDKPTPTFDCQVEQITPLGADVYQVDLTLPANCKTGFAPGQYLLLAADADDSFSPFSIASAPQQLPRLSLHILARDNSVPAQLIQRLRSSGTAQVRLPFGDVRLQDDEQPLLLIAAGTGLAQMHSMLESCRMAGCKHQIMLYWGAKNEDDFYHVSAAGQWRQMPNLRLHKIVSHDDSWHGRSGLLYEAVCQDIKDFSGMRVYVSGSPTMVYATLDALVAAGMQREQMNADVFSYAPRSNQA